MNVWDEWGAESVKTFPKLAIVVVVVICVVVAGVALVFLTPREGQTYEEPTNNAPTALFTYSPPSPTLDDEVEFADMSTDNDGTIVSWSWDFGDGTTSSERSPAHWYSKNGTFTVRLTVTDNGGRTGVYETSITVVGTGENVFQDFEPNNGTPGGYFYDAWRSSSSFEASTVHRGTRSVKLVVPAGTTQADGATLGINAASPNRHINLSGATTMSVWVYDMQGNNTVELKLKDITGNLGTGMWSTETSIHNTWTKLSWDISGYQGVDMSRIASIELYEWNEGTYYFDTILYS